MSLGKFRSFDILRLSMHCCGLRNETLEEEKYKKLGKEGRTILEFPLFRVQTSKKTDFSGSGHSIPSLDPCDQNLQRPRDSTSARTRLVGAERKLRGEEKGGNDR